MELTPQGIRDIEFREKLRGYHPDDVDAFVERVAAGVEELQQRLRAAEGAGPARTVVTADDGEVSEETIRRTLLMAQRTADMVLAEAQETAARSLAEAEESAARSRAEAEESAARSLTDAQESAARIVADAQAEAETMLSEATSDAQAMAQETIDRLQNEITRLETTRAALQEDIDELWVQSDTQRTQYRQMLVQALDVLDRQPAPDRQPTPDRTPREPAVVDAATSTVEPDAVDEVAEVQDEDDDLDTARPETPPMEPVDLVARGRGLGALVSDADDPFLAELRRAVEDHDAMPADDERPGVFDVEDDDAWAETPAGSPGDTGEPEEPGSESGRSGGRLFRRR